MADKLTLPKAKFAVELTAGKTDAAMKSAEATSTKLYNVPVGAIQVIPGFNVRVQSPDYIAHRDAIQASIAANGYDQTKPLAGYVATVDGENVIYVTDGHTRLDAVQTFNADPDTAEKDEITKLPILIRTPAPSLTDLTVALHTANSGRPLTPFELGITVKRLLAEDGADKKSIATRLGVTTRYLDDVLLLANADPKVKQHVAAGNVSSTMAIGLLRKDADTAGDKIEAAVAKTEGTGKKATKKAVDSEGEDGVKLAKVKYDTPFTAGMDMKALVKTIAGLVRKAIPAEAESEEDDAALLATVAGTVGLVISLPAPEKAKPKVPKAKAAKPAAKKPAAKAKPAAEEAEVAPKEKAKPAAKKPAAKAPAKAAPAKKGGKAKLALGIEGAEAADEGEDDEVVKLPPKVGSDEGIEEVDI